MKNNWNGESKTEIIAKAPYQESVEPSSVMVNATFYYCAKVVINSVVCCSVLLCSEV